MKRALLMDFGLSPYKGIWELQKRLVNDRLSGGNMEFILIGEHTPVYTLGRSGDIKNLKVSMEYLKSLGCDLFHVERGGDITWHGPGQIVCYPIFNLKNLNLDLHKLVYLLEEVMIRTLKKINIEGIRIRGMRGVWTEKGKIGSIGIAVKKGITYHGMSLNISPELRFFDFINPCGLKDVNICSIKSITGKGWDMEKAKEEFIKNLSELFNFTISNVNDPI